MNDTLIKYREALNTVDTVEDQLIEMVNFFFKDMKTKYKYSFNRLCYNAPGENSLLWLSYYEDDYKDLHIPTSILDTYFEGNKEKAKDDFTKWWNDVDNVS